MGTPRLGHHYGRMNRATKDYRDRSHRAGQSVARDIERELSDSRIRTGTAPERMRAFAPGIDYGSVLAVPENCSCARVIGRIKYPDRKCPHHGNLPSC